MGRKETNFVDHIKREDPGSYALLKGMIETVTSRQEIIDWLKKNKWAHQRAQIFITACGRTIVVTARAPSDVVVTASTDVGRIAQ